MTNKKYVELNFILASTYLNAKETYLVNWICSGIWINNIWIMEASELWTFRSLIFRLSIIQMPSSYYLPCHKDTYSICTTSTHSGSLRNGENHFNVLQWFYSGQSGFYPLYPCHGMVITESRQYNLKVTKLCIKKFFHISQE